MDLNEIRTEVVRAIYQLTGVVPHGWTGGAVGLGAFQNDAPTRAASTAAVLGSIYGQLTAATAEEVPAEAEPDGEGGPETPTHRVVVEVFP